MPIRTPSQCSELETTTLQTTIIAELRAQLSTAQMNIEKERRTVRALKRDMAIQLK
jgi:uncharacterized coiled-coil protein SlyX